MTSHPARYPVHDDPEKGQVYGGVCNITRCNNGDATMWNTGTYGFYCDFCARDINKWSHGEPLCVEVDGRKPTIEEMEALHRDNLEKSRGRTYAENARLYAAEQVYTIEVSDYDYDRPSKKALARPALKVIDSVLPKAKIPSRSLQRMLGQRGRK